MSDRQASLAALTTRVARRAGVAEGGAVGRGATVPYGSSGQVVDPERGAGIAGQWGVWQGEGAC